MIFGTTRGQDCCPEGGWGELLRKDGDPVYKDKGVVEKGRTNLYDMFKAYRKSQVRQYLGFCSADS